MPKKYTPSDKRRKNPWQDHYARKAQKEKYPARSVYKLKEIQQKFRLIKKGDCVLDLGCAPGSWLLCAAEMTGPTGRVVGVDLKAVSIRLPAWVRTQTADILQARDALAQRFQEGFDVVLSDMAPDTSGNKTLDSLRSFTLCEAAFMLAQTVLKPGGAFVCKMFQGGELEGFTAAVKQRYQSLTLFKPRSSRKASREIYIIGRSKIH